MGDTLREVIPADSAMLLAWRNSERVRGVMRTTHRVTQAEHDAWFAREGVRYIFEADGTPVGFMQFTLGDEWGFYIGAESAPKGCGHRMCSLSLDLAFGELGMPCVTAEVLRHNARSHALHRRLGFTATRTTDTATHYVLWGSEWTPAETA